MAHRRRKTAWVVLVGDQTTSDDKVRSRLREPGQSGPGPQCLGSDVSNDAGGTEIRLHLGSAGPIPDKIGATPASDVAAIFPTPFLGVPKWAGHVLDSWSALGVPKFLVGDGPGCRAN